MMHPRYHGTAHIQPEKNMQKDQVSEHHLMAAGVSQAGMSAAKAMGLGPADILALLAQFGPLALQFLTALQEILKKKQSATP
jgi:hypothetical protein